MSAESPGPHIPQVEHGSAAGEPSPENSVPSSAVPCKFITINRGPSWKGTPHFGQRRRKPDVPARFSNRSRRVLILMAGTFERLAWHRRSIAIRRRLVIRQTSLEVFPTTLQRRLLFGAWRRFQAARTQSEPNR